jgi:SAM-dependent methyltransferase
MSSAASTKFIQIDEEGYFAQNGVRVTDEDFGAQLLSELYYDNRILYTESDDTKVIVEAFDEPIIASNVVKSGKGNWSLNLPYGVSAPLDLRELCSDEWDRFHGYTEIKNKKGKKNKLPFVLSRAAQAEFFNLVEDFDDDGFTIDESRFEVRPWWPTIYKALRDREFWSEHYRAWEDDGAKPGWDLGGPAAPLKDILPQLKLNRSRIAVVGSGSAHDAAYLAQQGHIVTAIDFSPEAIAHARGLYGNVRDLEFVCQDILVPSRILANRFDIVFEHTFYTAVDPTARALVVDAYKRMLVDKGHLLGIFFVMDKGGAPPFGATEWEIRERLKKSFNFLYWTRWKKSIPRRLGKELVIYAQKRQALG